TATEIHDHLRVLFARVGRTVCGTCGSEGTKDTAEAAAQRPLGPAADSRLLCMREASRVRVACPVSAGGIPRADLFERLLKRGFRRLLAGEEALDLEGLDPAAEAPGGGQVRLRR